LASHHPAIWSIAFVSCARVEDNKISFKGINQYSRKWDRISTYGGKLVENMTQAVARDVFKSNSFRIVDAGYEIKLPVHDENICYAPDAPEFIRYIYHT